jgi:hypothetical protein
MYEVKIAVLAMQNSSSKGLGQRKHIIKEGNRGIRRLMMLPTL